MYRPENWKNGEYGENREIFEAGADAMLGGLRKDALYSQDEEKMMVKPHISALDMLKATDYKNGVVVFIPDEQVKKDE